MRETAYAKINLALHLRRRREDGYHELETLFAFLDVGDELRVAPAMQDSVVTVGEFAGLLDDPLDNLVARALNLLPHSGGIAVTLEKNLPVAAGLGGGSADAGAVFRILREMHGLPDGWHTIAAKLGADVPACVESVTCIGRGTGTELEAVDGASLTGTPALLVNPRVPLATGPVFAQWDGRDRGPMPVGDARTVALSGRNDLEEPAIALCPQIADVLMALAGISPLLARMSGSGATCFALYDTVQAREAAAAGIRDNHPEWWQMQGVLR